MSVSSYRPDCLSLFSIRPTASSTWDTHPKYLATIGAKSSHVRLSLFQLSVCCLWIYGLFSKVSPQPSQGRISSALYMSLKGLLGLQGRCGSSKSTHMNHGLSCEVYSSSSSQAMAAW